MLYHRLIKTVLNIVDYVCPADFYTPFRSWTSSVCHYLWCAHSTCCVIKAKQNQMEP